MTGSCFWTWEGCGQGNRSRSPWVHNISCPVEWIHTCTAWLQVHHVSSQENNHTSQVEVNYTLPVVNTLRPRQNGCHFPDDIFKCIFLNETVWISIQISLKFVLKVPINNIPALVQIMAWRRPGDKPLSEAIMVSLLTHVCVTRPQWVNCCTLQVITSSVYS